MNMEDNIKIQWTQYKVGYMFSVNHTREGAALYIIIESNMSHVTKEKII